MSAVRETLGRLRREMTALQDDVSKLKTYTETPRGDDSSTVAYAGGSGKQQKPEVAKLQQDIRTLQSDGAKYNKEIETLQKVQQKKMDKTEATKLQEGIRTLQSDVAKWHKDIDALQKLQKKLDKPEAAKLQQDIRTLQSDYANFHKDIDALQTEHIGHRQKMTTLQKDHDRVSQDTATVRADSSKLGEEVGALRSEVSTLRQEGDSLRVSLSEKEAALKALETKMGRWSFSQLNLTVERDKTGKALSVGVGVGVGWGWGGGRLVQGEGEKMPERSCQGKRDKMQTMSG